MSKKTLLRNKGKGAKDAKDSSIIGDGEENFFKQRREGKKRLRIKEEAKDLPIPIKPLEGKKPYERSTKKEYIDSPSGARSLFEIRKNTKLKKAKK